MGQFIGFRVQNLGRNCKNYFRVHACCFVNIDTVTYFNLFLCPFEQRDMSVMTETNLQKGGLVHRVPCTKSREKLQELFQSVL